MGGATHVPLSPICNTNLYPTITVHLELTPASRRMSRTAPSARAEEARRCKEQSTY